MSNLIISSAQFMVVIMLMAGLGSCGSAAPTYCPRQLAQIVLVDHQQLFTGPLQVEVCPATQERCAVFMMESTESETQPLARFCLQAAEYAYDVRLYSPSSDEVLFVGSFTFPSDDAVGALPSEAVRVWQQRKECAGIVVVNTEQSTDLNITAACSQAEFDAAISTNSAN